MRTLLERGGLLEKTVRPAETVGKVKQAAKREADAKQAAKEAAEAKADKAKGKAPATGAAASGLGSRKMTMARPASVGVGHVADKGSFAPRILKKTWPAKGGGVVPTVHGPSQVKITQGLDKVLRSMGVQNLRMFQNVIDLKWYTQEQMDNAIATNEYNRVDFFEESQQITKVVRNDGKTHSVVHVRIIKWRQQVVQCVSGCTCRDDPFAKIALWKDTHYEFATHSDGCPWKDEDIPDGELPLSQFTAVSYTHLTLPTILLV